MNKPSPKSEFAAPLAAARVLGEVQRPYFIGGGWAIDAALGSQSRAHKDLEVAILREDQSQFQDYLAKKCGAKLMKLVEGKLEPWRDNEWLALPTSEVYAEFPEPAKAGGLMRLHVSLNESQGSTWHYRRDTRVKLDMSRIGAQVPAGFPALNPVVVLMAVARAPRPLDETDFKRILPKLSYGDREWLRESLRLLQATHPWIERINRL